MLVLDEHVLDDNFLNGIDLEGRIGEIRKEGTVCLFFSDEGVATAESEAVEALFEKILSIQDLDGWIHRLVANGYDGWIIVEDECPRSETEPDVVTVECGVYSEEVLRPITNNSKQA